MSCHIIYQDFQKFMNYLCIIVLKGIQIYWVKYVIILLTLNYFSHDN